MPQTTLERYEALARPRGRWNQTPGCEELRAVIRHQQRALKAASQALRSRGYFQDILDADVAEMYLAATAAEPEEAQ